MFCSNLRTKEQWPVDWLSIFTKDRLESSAGIHEGFQV